MLETAWPRVWPDDGNEKDSSFLEGMLEEQFKIAPESTPEQGYRRLLDAADDYITIHQGFFGGYNGTLMPRPDKETRFRLRGKLLPFLDRHGLAVLKPAFEQYFMLYGYGYLSS